MNVASARRKSFLLTGWHGTAGKLLATWLACMIALPVVQWLFGDRALIAGVGLSVVLQASLVVVVMAQAAGARRIVLTVVSVGILAGLSEVIGLKTGVPFGAYRYTGGLQPQLLGVPLLIPLAWLMMLPPAWAAAQRMTRSVQGPVRPIAFVLAGAFAFTAWDLYLDPQMVHWGLWVWEQPGAFFGIPLANYGGWLLVSAIITAVVRPPELPERPLLHIYALTWLIEVAGLALFWRLYGPALAGFAGMGVFVLAAFTAKGRAARDETCSPDPVQGDRSTGQRLAARREAHTLVYATLLNHPGPGIAVTVRPGQPARRAVLSELV